MKKRKGKTHYRSYLLRLWSSGSKAGRGWRASLEDPQTGERLGFASLERLFAFLQDQTDDLAWENEPGLLFEEDEL
jgi:hypothetical protein